MPTRQMRHLIWTRLARGAAAAIGWGLIVTPAVAFTTPFTFHCTGDACHAVAFLDEGNGCTVVTNHSDRTVRITLGLNQLTDDLKPGDTFAPLIGVQCYGYYDGGETATFE